MSGSSSQEHCPRCGRGHFEVYTDWKPWDTISAQCLDCGFEIYTKECLMDIEDLESQRFESGFEIRAFTQEEKQRIKEFDEEYSLSKVKQMKL